MDQCKPALIYYSVVHESFIFCTSSQFFIIVVIAHTKELVTLQTLGRVNKISCENVFCVEIIIIITY